MVMSENKKIMFPKFKIRKYVFKPVFIILISFLLVILLGSILLYLPFSIKDGVSISYLDSLFTSTTCTCVTGLVSVKEGIASGYSLAGKIIMMILIQLGGLGVTTIGVIFFMIFSHKLSFGEQSLIKDSWNLNSLRGIKRIFLQILLVDIMFELFGFGLYIIDFYYLHNINISDSLFYAAFQAISMFNNAGITIIDDLSSFTSSYQSDLLFNLLNSFLIIAGGLGFIVHIEVIHKRFNFRKFNLHTKIVLTYSLFLLLFGTLAIYLIELTNSKTNVDFLGAFYLSVTSRTAGFTLYDLKTFNDASILIISLLMFVGASPGGTGGGVKTTTFAILVCYLKTIVTGKDPAMFKRSISKDLINKALFIIILGFSFFAVGLTLICIFEGNYSFYNIVSGEKYVDYPSNLDASELVNIARYSLLDFLFDAMSAFGTVGLSTGVTPFLTSGSKIVLIILMYVGRLGPLTISSAFKGKDRMKYKYVEENISIG